MNETGIISKPAGPVMTKEATDMIKVLLFRVMDTGFACIMHQVSGIIAPDEALDKYTAFFFHERIPFRAKPDYSDPKGLVLKSGLSTVAVIVDRVIDIVSVDIASVYGLPALIRMTGGGSALRGVIVYRDEMFFLVDLDRLSTPVAIEANGQYNR